MLLAPRLNIPNTPGGKNPYDVVGITPTPKTTVEEVRKQYKKQAVRCHPDREGGSNEKMSELNSAFKLIKENHKQVLDGLNNASAQSDAQMAYRQSQHVRAQAEEARGRTGGVGSAEVRQRNKKQYRNQAEVVKAFEEFKKDTHDKRNKMLTRFEIATEHGLFFNRIQATNDIVQRERTIRKTFIRFVWEEVHEMRSELMKKGQARNKQQSEIAEEMVAFATDVQRSLTDNLERVGQDVITKSTRLFVWRVVSLGAVVLGVYRLIMFVTLGYWRNTVSAKLSKDVHRF